MGCKLSKCQLKKVASQVLSRIAVLKMSLKFISISWEAVARRSCVKKVFLEISQNSLENTCASVSFLINLQALEFLCYVMLCFLYFDLAWNSSIHKYCLIKAKLRLKSNDPNIQTKNKNDLKYFLYYNYKIFV